MANSTFEVLEFRAIIRPGWTDLYIRCSGDSDGETLVGGWYKAVITPSVPAVPELADALRSCSFLTSDTWSRSSAPIDGRAGRAGRDEGSGE